MLSGSLCTPVPVLCSLSFAVALASLRHDLPTTPTPTLLTETEATTAPPHPTPHAIERPLFPSRCSTAATGASATLRRPCRWCPDRAAPRRRRPPPRARPSTWPLPLAALALSCRVLTQAGAPAWEGTHLQDLYEDQHLLSRSILTGKMEI